MTSSNDVPTPRTSNKSSKEQKQTKQTVDTTSAPVRTDSHKSIDHCEITCKTEKDWWERNKRWVEMAGVILLAVYTGYTIKYTHVAERSSRPFVGVETIDIGHQWTDKDGKLQLSSTPTSEATQMIFQINIKNFGPLPAESLKTGIRAQLDNIEQPGQGVPQEPSTLNPTQAVHIHGGVPPNSYKSVMEGTKVITFHLTISYKGPEGSYESCQVERYGPQFNAFMNVGACSQATTSPVTATKSSAKSKCASTRVSA